VYSRGDSVDTVEKNVAAEWSVYKDLTIIKTWPLLVHSEFTKERSKEENLTHLICEWV
jgi:hypothetical protein